MITYYNSPYAYDISCITQSACFVAWMGQEDRIKTTSLATIGNIARFISDDSLQELVVSETAVNIFGHTTEVTIHMHRNEVNRPCFYISRLSNTEGGEPDVLSGRQTTTLEII